MAALGPAGQRVFVSPPADWLVCAVCLDVLTSPASFPCGHTFCRACAGRCLSESRRACPVCRTALPGQLSADALPTNWLAKGALDELRVR